MFCSFGIIYLSDMTTCCEQKVVIFYIILLLPLAKMTKSHNRNKIIFKKLGQDYLVQNSNNGSKGLNWRTRLSSLMFNMFKTGQHPVTFPVWSQECEHNASIVTVIYLPLTP